VWRRDAFDLLRQVASGALPGDMYSTPATFAEAIAHACCAIEGTAGLDELVAMRAYVDGSDVPAARAELAIDRAATREQLSFIALLMEPHRLDSMRGAFETYRAAFASAYREQHTRYWKAQSNLARKLRSLAPAARALQRLNSLRALGSAAGEDALAAYHALSNSGMPCAAADLDQSLLARPVCAVCGLTLSDSVPAGQVEDVAHQLEAALSVQQRRLASEAVRRILARGGERLDRFIEIVQAADTASLAQLLDGELLVFLQGLLAQPVSPTPEALRLFEQIALTHPVITESDVDGVVQTLRSLLREQLEAQREGDSERVPSFYLSRTP
jgi:hypothetical protein